MPTATSPSTPAASAFFACSTVVTTCSHFVPMARNRGNCSFGPPCDATSTGTRAS